MIPARFHDLPVHPLAVHSAVVLIPLAALLAVLFVIPRTRAWAALPLAVVSIAGFLSLLVARESGFNLKAELQLGDLINNHEHQASLLLWFMLVFAIIAVGVYVLYRQADRFTGAVEYVACGVLIVGALVVAWQTYKTGEAGSRVLWCPTPAATCSGNASAPISGVVHFPG